MSDELPGFIEAAIRTAQQVWPHTIDAQVWAKQFMDHLPQFEKPIDEEIMCVWFANAIMAGYDTAQSRAAKPRPWLRAEEVTEEGFYWAAQPGFSGSEIHEIERRGGFLMAKPIRDEGSDHWYQIHKYGEVWQRIPEPELPEEES